ncbi:MAG: radical SAM protein [Colwellia sp.]|nr:radical SAM protein [Colwellia sp.]
MERDLGQLKLIKRVLLTHPVDLHKLQVYPDLGLGYIASSVKKSGFSVRIVLDALSRDDIIRYIDDFKPDVWGLKLFATTTTLVQRTIDIIRERDPNIIIIVGGPQVNGLPETILKHVPADYAMHGNSCERSFCNLLHVLNNHPVQGNSGFKAVDGLIYRENETIKVNKPDFIEDLDILPFPLWEEMNIYKYNSGQNQVTRYFPSAPMIMSRGCTAKCRFCNLNIAGNVQRRSAENVIEEMKLLKSMYRVKEILFQDSNFAYNRDETLHFCRLMLDEKLNMKWTLPQGTRIATLDEELCRILKKAGCYRISIGIEAGDKEMQRYIRKGVNLDKVNEKLKIIKKYGIEVLANFMMGFPGETKQQMQTTLEVALRLPLDYANFYVFTPYPGSSFFKELVEKGEIQEDVFQEWNKFTYRNNLSEMTADELVKFRTKMVWEFYLRPRQVLNVLSNFRYPTYVKVLLRVLFSHYLSTNFMQALYFNKR